MVQHRPLTLLLPLLLCLSFAQISAEHQGGNIHVYVTYPDDRVPGGQLRVALISGSNGDAIGEMFTNDRGEATFLNVAIGNYHVSVSGDGIQATQSDTFQVDERIADGNVQPGCERREG